MLYKCYTCVSFGALYIIKDAHAVFIVSLNIVVLEMSCYTKRWKDKCGKIKVKKVLLVVELFQCV